MGYVCGFSLHSFVTGVGMRCRERDKIRDLADALTSIVSHSLQTDFFVIKIRCIRWMPLVQTTWLMRQQ
jgi:hypothetical protein